MSMHRHPYCNTSMTDHHHASSMFRILRQPVLLLQSSPAVTAARSDGLAVAEVCCSRIQWTAAALTGAVWTGADTNPCSGIVT